MEKTDENVRYCKKCGCELVSTNKHKKCENCRNRKYGTIKKIFIGVTTLCIGAVKFKNRGNKT